MSFIESFDFYRGAGSFPLQRHIDCEIIYVTDGSIEISYGKEKLTLSKNQLCLIPSGVLHRSFASDERYSRYVMFVNTWKFSSAYSSVRLQDLISGIGVYRPVTADCGEDIHEIFEQIKNEYQSNSTLSDDMIYSLVIGLLVRIVVNNPELESLGVNEAQSLVMNIRSYIQQNCSSQLKMSKVAERFYISNCYLSHIFKEQTDMSPKEFLISCRISKAGYMLTGTDHCISDISEECGFPSPSDMTVRFKKECGMTPKEYRESKRRMKG